MQLSGYLLFFLPLGNLVAAAKSCSSSALALAERDNDGAWVYEMLRREAAAEERKMQKLPKRVASKKVQDLYARDRAPVSPSGPSAGGNPEQQAQEKINKLKAHGCDFGGCMAAAAACTAACASAAAEGFTNPIADLACAGTVYTFIDICKECNPESV